MSSPKTLMHIFILTATFEGLRWMMVEGTGSWYARGKRDLSHGLSLFL